MEHNKKRRNSILKKTQINNEETTSEITSKITRRISFSGKKSVKEFRPGEEEATIWGTSYEESAEVLHANSTESGLVNVNEKRIMLRNRRVIVEPNKTTHRRSNKKVSVAENDKENVFTQQSQAEASKIASPPPPATVEPETVKESPVKSELALMKIHLEDKNSQTMSEPLERGNICSSTFDFINYSGLINKSITIEQSVDVTLNENELHMFKFRVPVRATDVSPNLSISSTRDGSSPNIFSRSILMSEVDSNMLKLIRGNREIVNLAEPHLTEMEARKIEEQRLRDTPIEKSVQVLNTEQQEAMAQSRKSDVMQLSQTTDTDNHTNQSMNVSHLVAPHSNSTRRKTIIKVVDMEEDTHRNSSKDTMKSTTRNTLIMNQNMNVSQVGKSLKRKTVTKVGKLKDGDDSRMDRRTISHPTAMDLSSMDFNSPLRKKPMHNATNNQMDITDATTVSSSRAEPIKRQTIHYESAVVEESLACDVDEMTCRSPFDASMEQSMAVADAARQTIYFDHNQIHEDSNCQSTRPTVAVKRDNDMSVDLSACMETLDAESDSKANEHVAIIEDFPKTAKANATSSDKMRQTICTPADIIEEADPHVVLAVKPRLSIYTSSAIVVDSPSPKKAQKSKSTAAISADITENATGRNQRKSVFTAADITIDDSPKATTVSEPSTSTIRSRQTIYCSTDIDEDVPTQAQPSKSGVKQRQSIYTPTDIIEDSPNGKLSVPQRCKDIIDEPAVVVRIPTKIPTKQRHTIYTSSDIMEDSPEPNKQHGPHQSNATQRQSVYIPFDMIEDSPYDVKSNVLHSKATLTSSEMSDDPSDGRQVVLRTSFKQPQSEAIAGDPNIPKPMEAIMPKPSHRQSIYTPSDMIVDSPKGANNSIQFSDTLQSSLKGANKQPQTKTYRQSIYTSADMDENSPKVNELTGIDKPSIQQRKSTHFVTEMVEEYPEMLESSLKTSLKQPHRQTIYAVADMIEDSPKASVASDHQALDDITDEPPSAKPPKVVVRHLNLKQGIFGQQAVLRLLKNQQSKTKLLTQANADDSSMEMSIHDDPPSPANKLNFCQLNEEMLKGKSKACTEERKGKSLFDDLEKKPIEDFKIDSFMDKDSKTGCIMQPARNSMRDYTMELSFSNRKKLDSGYTMDLSLDKTAVKSFSKQQCKEETIDLAASMAFKQTSHATKLQTSQEHDDDTMDLSTVGCSKPLFQSEEQTLPINASQGIGKFQGNSRDCELSTITSKNISKRQTINVHHEMDLDETIAERAQSLSHSERGQQNDKHSTHFDPDLDPEDSSDKHLCYRKSPAPSKANIQNQQKRDLQSSRRLTLHFNDDIEEEARQTVLSDETKRNTAENSRRTSPKELDSKSKRQTIYFNQDVEVEEDTSDNQSHSGTLPAPIREHIQTQQTAEVQAYNRTLHFNDDIELAEDAPRTALYDETRQKTADSAKRNRQTIHFHQNNDLEKSVDQPSQCDPTFEVEIVRSLPKPKRLTVLDNAPLDVDESPQKCTLRKSSFSRTLNFNAIQTNNSKIQRQETDDYSPVYDPRSRGHDITSEIDRSLVEYLKAEQATMFFRSTSPDTSTDMVKSERNDVHTGYDNNQQSQSKLRIAHEPVNIFEESGMQPLQKCAGLATTSSDATDELARVKTDMIKETRLNVQAIPINRSQPIPEMQEARANMQANRTSLKKFDYLQQKPKHVTTECDNSMEMSVLSEEPVAIATPKKTNLRKTIHFTNENAVDESFFDENLSKPVTSMKHKSHQTVFFNESKNSMSQMDVTVANSKSMTRSKAVQSMKEILMENNMLFTQTRPLQPFESKRSTINFAGKDDSLDMSTANESMECDIVDVECFTPTKNKLSKSRIPKLIDSAKKLQSLKTTMEYIQQELPNIGSHLQKAITTNEQDEEVPPVLHQESFETVEIPRRATSRSFRIFQDTLDTDSRVPEQAKLQESFETIEIPRSAIAFQQNDTLHLCPNATINTSQKSFYKFEDKPITISDVSTFFSQKPLPATNEPYSPNTTEALCNLDVNVIAVDDQLPKSSDSEDTTQHIDKFKKRYVDLTCDSISLSGLIDDIDKTRLSLVNTLDEEASEIVLPSNSSAKVPTVPASPLKPVPSVCRKCKHRLSVTQNDTTIGTIGSFMLEPQPEYKFDLSVLEALASKPKISDVANVWRQRMRDSDSFNVSDGSGSITFAEEDMVHKFIAELDKNRLGTAARQRQPKAFKKETSFVQNVKKRIESQKSNWILNELLLSSNILRFSHTRIRTFAIFITFTPRDPRGIEVNFNEIKLAPNVLHTRQWTPFDSALHYQLLVELPFDLRKLCPTSDNLFEMLQQIEEVTQNVLKTGKDMLYLVLTSPASLIRESSGSIYIRKCARTKTPQYDVRRAEFLIEVRNIKQLSYKSIVVPPLYEFDEKIQMLPVGHEFLRTFLADPIQYMKS